MQIIYADDEPGILKQVCNFLQQHGHMVCTINTTNILDFQEKLVTLLSGDFVPDVVIIGGHNLLRDREGHSVFGFDIEGFVINKWLETQDLPPTCRYILFSRDQALVEKAQQRREWGFQTGILKNSPEALAHLLQAIERD
ncbi:MAG: hypothetical protein WCS37_19340 [Chloroflexota bacterium]|nr:hypothetical protein [Chloroflexota bacterium]